MSESNYILGQVIARGGMAEVYRGLHVGQDGFRRLVAVKRVLPQYASNKEFAEMFRDEAHIGQRLQHANVVKVECFSIIEQSPSIVMEFVDGSDLRSILAEIERTKSIRRMPIAMALYIIAEAARGLHYAHTRRDDVSGRPLDIVHRDISPQNILVSYNGEVKVTDFGIASADQDFKLTETKAGIVKGKYSYMSPEQISAKKVDARTDIFALAIVMWEMLAMRRLFTADNEVDVIDMVKNCRIPHRLREINPEISPEIESIVLRGLAKDVKQRFATMDEFERTLRNALSKTYPNFTVSDFGGLLKQVLSVKHEASQLEIKKMLTSTSLKAGTKSSGSLELDLGGSSASQERLMVSRFPTNAANNNQGRPLMQVFSQKQSQLSRDHFSNIGSKQRSKAASSASTLKIAFVVTIALLVAVLFKVQANAAKDGVTTILKTNPSSVKIRLNGTSVKNNRFMRTPLTLRLDRGANIIEVSRPGYETETVTVDTARDEHKDLEAVFLKALGSFAPTRFVIIGKEGVQINVNDGFAIGNLTSKQPYLDLRDTLEGQILDVLVTESSQKSFRCKVSVIRAMERKAMLIHIDTAKDKCIIASSSQRER